MYLTAGTYYVVVDGYGTAINKMGAYDLLVDNCGGSAQQNGDCNNPLPIACGQNVSGNTANGFNNFNTYSGASQNEYGKDLVYEFTLTQPSNIQAELSNLSADLDIHLLQF